MTEGPGPAGEEPMFEIPAPPEETDQPSPEVVHKPVEDPERDRAAAIRNFGAPSDKDEPSVQEQLGGNKAYPINQERVHEILKAAEPPAVLERPVVNPQVRPVPTAPPETAPPAPPEPPQPTPPSGRIIRLNDRTQSDHERWDTEPPDDL